MAGVGNLFLGTFLFLIAEAVGFAAVAFSNAPKGKKQLNQVLVATTVVCCWSMWAIIYIAQMHPLVRPIIPAL